MSLLYHKTEHFLFLIQIFTQKLKKKSAINTHVLDFPSNRFFNLNIHTDKVLFSKKDACP